MNCKHKRDKASIKFDGIDARHASPTFKTFTIEWVCVSCRQVIGHGPPMPRSWLNADAERLAVEMLSR